MQETNHALLSPSSSHRWLNCTKSTLLETEFENKESKATAEGSAAHKLCEHKVKKLCIDVVSALLHNTNLMRWKNTLAHIVIS